MCVLSQPSLFRLGLKLPHYTCCTGILILHPRHLCHAGFQDSLLLSEQVGFTVWHFAGGHGCYWTHVGIDSVNLKAAPASIIWMPNKTLTKTSNINF